MAWLKNHKGKVNTDDMDSDMLYKFFKTSNDQEGFMHSLDYSQQAALQREIERNRVTTMDRINKEVDAILNEIPGMNRKVGSSITLKVSDWPSPDIVKSKKKIACCNLTIYDPAEELVDRLREGL